MWNFLAVSRPPECAAASDRFSDLSLALQNDPHWLTIADGPGFSVWATEPRPNVQQLPGGGVLLGDAFDGEGHPRTLGEDGREATPHSVAHRLCEDLWGGYVAVFGPRGEQPAAVYREPSAAMACYVWPLGDGLYAAGSNPLGVPAALRPPRLALNWARIGTFFAAPSTLIDPLFDGLDVVPPGFLRHLADGPGRTVQVWRPADLPAMTPDELAGAATELVRRVDMATERLTAPYRGLVMEVSGGLDSAIVAASLAQAGGRSRVRAWTNYSPGWREGDETSYARAVTDRLGVELTSVPLAAKPAEESDFSDFASSLAPAINALDAHRDSDAAERLLRLGCQATLSGQGGDAVFFQMASPLLVVDALKRLGWRAALSPSVVALARRRRMSVWAALLEARRARRGGARPPTFASALATDEAAAFAAGQQHPWMAGLEGVPAARRLQIRAIANCQLVRGDSRRSRAGDLVIPLLAQPVMEHCLRIPPELLAGGLEDRAFARAAFVDRLPVEVRERRSKGSFLTYYARWVGENLAFFRAYLLDGCLCEAGVVDRAKLDSLLQPDSLLRTTDAPDVLTAAMLEAWVRYWQGRVPDSLRASRF
jgi:asparagine synthase (glutamine-hydrolysing)